MLSTWPGRCAASRADIQSLDLAGFFYYLFRTPLTWSEALNGCLVSRRMGSTQGRLWGLRTQP